MKYKRKYNKFQNMETYMIGYTTNNEPFFFDIEDYDKIKDFCWYIDNKGYVKTNYNHTSIRIHRIIMGVNDTKVQIDHINHNPRDNRKFNLRKCSNLQNNYNKGLSKRNKSGVLGVFWNKQMGKWHAKIQAGGKNISLGFFNDLEKAKEARKSAEILYFKEFAYRG